MSPEHLIVSVAVLDSDEVTFSEAICEVPKCSIPGSANGYPSMNEVARVVARYGDPERILRDAATAMAASRGRKAIYVLIATDEESINVSV